MVEFLSVRATNRLLQAVQADLAVSDFVAGCRALGLIGKDSATATKSKIFAPFF